MRYFRAFYTVDRDDDTDLRSLQDIHKEFDDKVFVLPYHRVGWGNEMNFAATLIFKESMVSWERAQDVLESAICIWNIDDIATQIRIEECTVEDVFMDSMVARYSTCCFDEGQVKRLLNLNNMCTFISSCQNGMKETIVEPSDDAEKLYKLTRSTPYAQNLSNELQKVLESSNLMVIADPDANAAKVLAEADNSDWSLGPRKTTVPYAPITYIVEGNVLSDADEAISILVKGLSISGRLDSGHVFTIDIDSHDRWLRRDNDGHYRSFINPQLIRAIEGNTLVLRYGAFESNTSFDIESYKLLTMLLDLMEDAAVGTQLILSIPEGNPELVTRLRKCHNRPTVLISKDVGTAMSGASFESNLAMMESMAAERGIKADESMGTLLSKRMRANGDAELERVFEEWILYHDARIAFPKYADVIDEAINLGISDEEVSAQTKLDSLIGLEYVKEHVRNIIMRIEMNQTLLEKGLPMQQFSMHMAFVGAPGTGKTEVARLYAEILKDKGILSEGRVVTVSGGSGFDVKKAFEMAKGSVLFVDEAYGMLGSTTSITEFIAQMENNRSDTVVILAGYEGHMDALISSNPGFRSRIGFTIKFPDYSADELRSIFSYMCERQELIMDAGVEENVRDILERGGRRADYGNARFVRKLFEDAVGAQQVRLAEQMKENPDAKVDVDDLRTLTVEDMERAKSSLGFECGDGKSGREELERLIGLSEVKELVSARMDFAKMQKVKRDAGMDAPYIPMHMAFKGNPGTGKTEVARLIGRILREEGVLSVGDFFECGRQDLVSPAVGGSAPKVEALFEEARGSVIFIDEAYSLIDGAKGGPGDEAINALIDQMEKLREEVVVIFAGYTKEIDDLLSTNPGFKSRVKTQIEFSDYTADELIEILHHMADKQGYTLAEGVDAKVREIGTKAMCSNEFGNARFVRNIFEEALVRQSVRLMKSMGNSVTVKPKTNASPLSKDEIAELSILVPEDFHWEPQKSDKSASIGFAA